MLSIAVIIVKVSLLLGVSSYVFSLMLNSQDRRWIQAKPLWLITLAFPAALLLPNIWILMGGMVVLIPLLARDRGEAAAIYVIALLSLPAMEKPVWLGSIWIIQLSTYHCLSIGLLIASFVMKGEVKADQQRLDLAFFILLSLNLISSARGLNATSTMREVTHVLVNYALPYWALRRSIVKPKDLSRLILAFCFVGAVLSVIALYEAKTFWPIYEMLPAHFGMPPALSQALKVRAGFMRGNATLPESTSLSWLLAISFMATFILKRGFRTRAHWYVALSVIVGGLLATQARGGWIAAVVGLIALDIYRRRWSTAGRKVALVGILYAGLSLLSRGSLMLSETLGKTGGAASTVDYRQELSRRGMEEIAKHPWMGTDLTTALSHLEDLRQGEGIVDFVNAYIYFGITTGLLGMIAYFTIFLIAAGSSMSVRSDTQLVSAMEMGALGFAVSIFTALSSATSGFGGSAAIFFLIILASIKSAQNISCRGKRQNHVC